MIAIRKPRRWLSSSFLIFILAGFAVGCGQPEPIIGLKFPEMPPTRPVDGPGFTVEIPETWVERVDGKKLIVSSPDAKDATVAIIELQPYGVGETSENILDATQKERSRIKTLEHRRMEFTGLKGYRQLYTRLKTSPSIETAYYMVAAPGQKIVTTMEAGTAERFLRDIIPVENILLSMKLK